MNNNNNNNNNRVNKTFIVQSVFMLSFLLYLAYLFYDHHFGCKIVENVSSTMLVCHPYTTSLIPSVFASKSGNLYLYECTISLDEMMLYAIKEQWKMVRIPKGDYIIAPRYNWIKYFKHYREFEQNVKKEIGCSDQVTDSFFHIVHNGFIYDNFERQVDRRKLRVKAVYDLDNNKLYVCYIVR